MHLHFGRPARPDPETDARPEPEPELGPEPQIALEPQVDVALALASLPEDDLEAVPPIAEGAGTEPHLDGAAPWIAPTASAGRDDAGDDTADAAPTGETAEDAPAGEPYGAMSAAAMPAGEAIRDTPTGETAEPTADAWPEMDPIAPAAPPPPVRRSGRNGDPAPVGLTAPTPPSGWTDPMTSADGPHYWDRLISSERDRIRRYHRPATVVFIELANLDRLGALWGDDVAAQALIRVGRTLMQQIRSSDHAARIDMGRFAVFLPETNEIAAINFVERVRAAIDASLGFMDETLQVGIGWASPADGDIDAALTIAERRLDTDLGRD